MASIKEININPNPVYQNQDFLIQVLISKLKTKRLITENGLFILTEDRVKLLQEKRQANG